MTNLLCVWCKCSCSETRFDKAKEDIVDLVYVIDLIVKHELDDQVIFFVTIKAEAGNFKETFTFLKIQAGFVKQNEN